MICRFVFSEHSSATYIVPASVLSPTLLRCSTPSIPHTGTALLYVNPDTKVDDDKSVIPFKFHFYQDCHVSGVFPAFLPNPFWGNTDITIMGTGFVLSANLLAFFGSYSFGVPVQFINSMAVRVSPPKAVYVGGAEGFLEVHVSNNGGVNFCQVEGEGIFLNFSLYNVVESSTDTPIDSVGPLLGPISGGTKVFLNGRGVSSLTGDLVCRFGGTKLNNNHPISTSVKLSSESETFCTVPPSPGLLSTSVEVAVLISGSSTPIYAFDFVYSQVPSVLAMLPTLGPTTGGTLLTIQGGGFPPANTSIGKLICVFSSREAADIEGDDILTVQSTSPGTLISPNEVQCLTPPLTEGITFVHVSLSTDSEFLGIDKQQNLLLGHDLGDGVPYEFYVLPSVISLNPSFGYKGGGYQMVISGERFLPLGHLSVKFDSSEGSVTVGGTYLSTSEILCVVPSLPPGSFTVSVSNNNQDFSNYYYNDSLSFSGQYANVEFKSINEEMMVISSTPRFGPVSGGSTVFIRGENLHLSTTRGEGGLFCQFGKEKVLPMSMNDTMVTCISPRVPGGGPVDVSISLITEVGFNNSIIPGEMIYFTYVEPVVLTVQPLWGPAYGGTTVRVVGQGFPSGPHPSIRCSFGFAGYTPAVWVSEEILLCVSPSSPFGYVGIGDVNFSVHFSTDDIFPDQHITKYNVAGHIQNATAAVVASANGTVLLPRFIYVEPCICVDIYPKSGPSLGGTQVVVTGMFFHHAPELSVRFGTQDVSAEWLNETALLCISPAFALPGDVKISVHYGNVIYNEAAIMSCESDEKVTFTYIGYEAITDGDSNITSSIPMVMGIFPSWGPSSGGTEITVFGFGFTERDYISCVFGNATPVNSTWVNSSTFRCITPHSSTSTTVNKNELFSLSWLPADPAAGALPISIYSEIDVIQFQFLGNCQTYNIWPKSAPTSGGTELFIFGAGFPVNDDAYM